MRGEGCLFSFDVDGTVHETKTFTCGHCNRVVLVKPKCDPCDLGGMCRLCASMICPNCVDRGICVPIEKKLENEERKYLRQWAMGL